MSFFSHQQQIAKSTQMPSSPCFHGFPCHQSHSATFSFFHLTVTCSFLYFFPVSPLFIIPKIFSYFFLIFCSMMPLFPILPHCSFSFFPLSLPFFSPLSQYLTFPLYLLFLSSPPPVCLELEQRVGWSLNCCSPAWRPLEMTSPEHRAAAVLLHIPSVWAHQERCHKQKAGSPHRSREPRRSLKLAWNIGEVGKPCFHNGFFQHFLHCWSQAQSIYRNWHIQSCTAMLHQGF